MNPRSYDRTMRNTILALAVLTFPGALSAQEIAQTAASAPDVEAIYRDAQAAYEKGAIARAITLYTEVIRTEPAHVNAHLQRGFCFTMQREYQRAVEDFTAVIEAKNDHLWAYTSRGSAYAKLGKHDMAMRDFDRVIELDPKNEEAFNNRGWSKKASGDTKGACADWKTSKKMGNAEARIILENNHCK